MSALRSVLERRPIATAMVYTIVGSLPLYLTAAQSPVLQRELGFGKTEFGVMVAAFYLVSSIASRRVGPMLDRRGPTIGLRAGALLSLLSAGLIASVVQRWETFALSLGIAGLANAYGQVAANLAISSVVRGGRQGLAFSAKQASVPLGATIAGLVLPWVGIGSSWRWVYAAMMVAAAAAALVAPHYEATPRRGARASGKGARLTAPLVALMIANGVAGGIGNSTAAFVSDAAVTTGFTPATAARLLTLGSIVAVITRVTAGVVADRRQKQGLLEVASLMVIGAGGLVTLALTQGSPLVFALGVMIAFGGAWGWQGVIFYTVVSTVNMPAATSTGAVAAAAYLGTLVMPPLVGAVAEATSYTVVFAGQALLLLLSVGAVLASRRLARAPQPAP